MRLSRRALLKTAAIAGAAAAAAPGGTGSLLGWLRRRSRPVPALAADGGIGRLVELQGLPKGADDVALARAGDRPRPLAPAPATARWVMVIDLALCDGCGACTEACTAMHFVPPGQEWIKVYRHRDNAVAAPYWFPRPCMQCDNPPCVKVCPVSATYKREDGVVIQDTARCIGCRFCIAACPYSARSFNWIEPPHTPEELARPYSTDWNYPHRKGTTEKCIFCPTLLHRGEIPACAQACPMGAIYFGDETRDVAVNNQGQQVKLSELIKRNAGFRYLEELGTEPRVYYLPPRGRVYPEPPDAEPRQTGD